MISRYFQTVRRVREAWKWGNMFGLSLFHPSRQSNPSPRRSHVGRRKIQISPPPGKEDWSNALPHALSPPSYKFKVQRTLTEFGPPVEKQTEME